MQSKTVLKFLLFDRHPISSQHRQLKIKRYLLSKQAIAINRQLSLNKRLSIFSYVEFQLEKHSRTRPSWRRESVKWNGTCTYSTDVTYNRDKWNEIWLLTSDLSLLKALLESPMFWHDCPKKESAFRTHVGMRDFLIPP